MRQQETKAERKIERYRREGVEQKSKDGNTTQQAERGTHNAV